MSFPPIYIIKMPGSQRNPELYKSLENLGIEYKIQDAVVGKNLSKAEIKSRVNLRSCDARLGYRISNNLIGSGLSHREIYKKAFAANLNWVLILEEDAILKDFDSKEIYEFAKINGDTPTIIQLFSRAARLMDSRSIKKLNNGERIIFNFKPRIAGCGAPGYLINRAAIELALSNNKLAGAPDWPEWAQKVQIKGIYPWMITESDMGSTMPVMPISRFKYIFRRILQFTGIHYLLYINEYPSFRDYFKEEITPYLLHIRWKVGGSKFYLNQTNGPQIIR
jgi:GR25 family glycosyltransferase involved in LPS biosynthesis